MSGSRAPMSRAALQAVLLVALWCVTRLPAAEPPPPYPIGTENPDDVRWRAGFHRTGFDERVYAFTTYHGELIAAGMFTRTGGTVLDLIARWDGAEWRPLGGGLTGGLNGAALVEFEGRLIVGGHFRKAGDIEAHGVAAWDGTEWHAMGSGFNGFVKALCVYRDTLIVGGTFIEADGAPASGLAFWDGSAWKSLRSGVTGGTATVSALVVYDGLLAIAGHFDEFAGVQASNVVFWDGEHAQPLGEGLSFATEALAVFGPDLIAGGFFRNAGGRPANSIAAWNGSGWRDIGGVLGDGFPAVTALTVHEERLYVGGFFSEAGGVSANNVASWDGSSWQALGSGTDGLPDFLLPPICRAIHPYGGELYFGGEFLLAGGVYTPAIARWTEGSWKAVAPGEGIPGLVYDIEVYLGRIAVGGGFRLAGDEPQARCIGLWNGAKWEALASGLDSTVTAIREFEGGLVAGGGFLHASGIPASRVARWDGTTWHPMGAGFDGTVWDLLVMDGILYAGGSFTRSGSVEVNHVALWDGSAWTALGAGLDETVHTLAVHRDTLVAGGNFSTSGSTPAHFVAKWDGHEWRAIGDGLNMSVHALATFRGDLIAGGRAFAEPGALARWNGSEWERLIPSESNVVEVNALHVLNDKLFVGGQFARLGSLIGGIPAANVVRWDGSTWSALGSGTDHIVLDLSSTNGSLLVGGGFGVAGGKGSAGIAIWDEIPIGVGIHDLRASRTASGVSLTWISSQMADIDGIRVQRATRESGPYEDRTAAPLDPRESSRFDDRELDADTSYWYRLLLQFRHGSSAVVGPLRVDALRDVGPGTEPILNVGPTATGVRIHYRLEAGPVPVQLDVFDVRGRSIIQLERSLQPAGDYVRIWDQRGGNGWIVPSGHYFFRLVAGASKASARISIVH